MDRQHEAHGFSALPSGAGRPPSGQVNPLLREDTTIMDERTISSARVLFTSVRDDGPLPIPDDFLHTDGRRMPPFDSPRVLKLGAVALWAVLVVFGAAAYVIPTAPHSQDMSPLDAIGLVQDHFGNGALEDEKIEIVGFVSWRTHPKKCWDFSHHKSYTAPHSGMPLRIHDCMDDPDKFLIPVKGTGPIKIVKDDLGKTYPYCLDAPGGMQLQFWNCSGAPEENLMFLPNQKGMGTYRLEKNLTMCVDVPNNDGANGKMLQMWNCHIKAFDQHFSVHAPVNCEWGQWGRWAACSAHCGGGERRRARAKAYGVTVQKSSTGQSYFYALKKLDRPHGGGKDCPGAQQEKEICNTHQCTDTNGQKAESSLSAQTQFAASAPETTIAPVHNGVRALHDQFQGVVFAACLATVYFRTLAIC